MVPRDHRTSATAARHDGQVELGGQLACGADSDQAICTGRGIAWERHLSAEAALCARLRCTQAPIAARRLQCQVNYFIGAEAAACNS